MPVPHGKDGTSPPGNVLVPTDIAVIVGNPKPHSRTLLAATGVAECLSGASPRTVIDLATLGVGLLTPGVFLDGMPPGALTGTIAFPLMLGAGAPCAGC